MSCNRFLNVSNISSSFTLSTWYQEHNSAKSLDQRLFLSRFALNFLSMDPKNSSLSSPSDLLAHEKYPIYAVNMNNVTKLSSVNYLTWSVQVKSLLKGYNLVKFIDNSTELPSTHVKIDGVDTPNPELEAWHRQDSLLYSALIGAIETPLQLLITTAVTSLEAWNTLAVIYAKPTRGHIKQLKQ